MLFQRQLTSPYELVAHRDVMLLFTRVIDAHQMALATAQNTFLMLHTSAATDNLAIG